MEELTKAFGSKEFEPDAIIDERYVYDAKVHMYFEDLAERKHQEMERRKRANRQEGTPVKRRESDDWTLF